MVGRIEHANAVYDEFVTVVVRGEGSSRHAPSIPILLHGQRLRTALKPKLDFDRIRGAETEGNASVGMYLRRNNRRWRLRRRRLRRFVLPGGQNSKHREDTEALNEKRDRSHKPPAENLRAKIFGQN